MNTLQFATFIVSWTAPVIALIVAWMTNRKRKYERAFLSVVAIRSGSRGGVEIDLENDGGRPAIDVAIKSSDGATYGRDGLRPGARSTFVLEQQAPVPFSFELSFSDADGVRRTETREVVGGNNSLTVGQRPRKQWIRRLGGSR